MFYWNDIKRATLKILSIYAVAEIFWVAKHQIMKEEIHHIPYFVTIGILAIGIVSSLLVQDMLDDDDILD